MSRWAWATYVVDQGWFRMGRCDIGKPAPAGLNRLKISQQWIEGVRTQLRSRDRFYCAIEQRRRVSTWLTCRVSLLVWLHLYGATSCARSYRWPGRPRQLSLPMLGEVAPITRKNERVELEKNSELWVRRCELPVVLEPSSRKAAFATIIYSKLANIACILCIVITVIINARTTVLYWFEVHKRCIFVILCLCRY